MTCLHPEDAIFGFGIDPTKLTDEAQWPNREIHRGIGGQAVSYVVPAQYAFQQHDGAWLLYGGEIRIAQLTQHNQTLPSILGWDVLQHFRLVTDWVGNDVYLEVRRPTVPANPGTSP